MDGGRYPEVVTEPAPFDAMRPGHGAVRLVRSATVALICTTTAAGAHVLGGGVVPTSAVTILFIAAAFITWLVSSRRGAAGQMVGLLVLCQVYAHLGFSMGSMHMSVSMLAMHAVATAISALGLARGESFVWRVANRLGLRTRRPSVELSAMPSQAVLMAVMAPRSLIDIRLTYSRSLRGPPIGI